MRVDANPFFVADAAYVPQLEAFMDELRKSGDSVGARITAVAHGVPLGWGEPVYDKLDADIAYAMMSINAVKGVEIGAGFAAVAQKGTEHCDEMTPEGFVTQQRRRHSGRHLHRPGHRGERRGEAHLQHPAAAALDRQARRARRWSRRTAATIRASASAPRRSAEAMLAIVLMDHALRHRAQNADVSCDTPRIAAQAPGAPS